MKRFLINVYTNWCGEDNDFSAIANDESELRNIASNLAYDNFTSFTGFEGILEELFPEVEEGEYTEEQTDEAIDSESEYYGYTIEEWDETRPEEEWDWYELIYDASDNEENIN